MSAENGVRPCARCGERLVVGGPDDLICCDRCAIEVTSDLWVERLSTLCDDEWLRQRDRAMDLHGTKTHGWVRRGASAWETAARQVRAVLNDLANYEDEYVDTHAAYQRWMTNGRDEATEEAAS